MPEVQRDIELARAAHVRLLAVVGAAAEAGMLDPAVPSRLPGWTRGHVLTHLARNADGHRRMIEAADRGEVADQYVGGVEGREREIAAGAGRGVDELVADLSEAIGRLEAAWATSPFEGVGRRTLAGETPVAELPFLRAREVNLHLVDLDLGVEFADLDRLYVRLELRRLEMTWSSRLPMGLTRLPPAALELPPPDRLAWLTGRLDLTTHPDLPPAAIFETAPASRNSARS